jgi:hypothetical protein
MSAPARIGHMQGVRWGEILPAPAPEEGPSICPHQHRRSELQKVRGASLCPHQRRRRTCKECGGASICPQERMQGVQGASFCPHQRERSTCKDCGGRASARTSASGALARSAAWRRMSRCARCRTGWRSSGKMLLAQVGRGETVDNHANMTEYMGHIWDIFGTYMGHMTYKGQRRWTTRAIDHSGLGITSTKSVCILPQHLLQSCSRKKCMLVPVQKWLFTK